MQIIKIIIIMELNTFTFKTTIKSLKKKIIFFSNFLDKEKPTQNLNH